jgi:hypothetical protein
MRDEDGNEIVTDGPIEATVRMVGTADGASVSPVGAP